VLQKALTHGGLQLSLSIMTRLGWKTKEICSDFQHRQDMFFLSKAFRQVPQPTQSLFNEHRTLLSWWQGVKHPGCKAETTIKKSGIYLYFPICLLPYMPSWKTQGQHPFTLHLKSLTYDLNNS
jgi:hypothetical protein